MRKSILSFSNLYSCAWPRSQEISCSREQDSFDPHIEAALACSFYHGDANQCLNLKHAVCSSTCHGHSPIPYDD